MDRKKAESPFPLDSQVLERRSAAKVRDALTVAMALLNGPKRHHAPDVGSDALTQWGEPASPQSRYAHSFTARGAVTAASPDPYTRRRALDAYSREAANILHGGSGGVPGQGLGTELARKAMKFAREEPAEKAKGCMGSPSHVARALEGLFRDGRYLGRNTVTQELEELLSEAGVSQDEWQRSVEDVPTLEGVLGARADMARGIAEFAAVQLESMAADQSDYLPVGVAPYGSRYLEADFIRRIVCASPDGANVEIEADGSDFIVYVPAGDKLNVTLSGDAEGSLFLVGPGAGHAARVGAGNGDVGRYGSGPGHSIRLGKGKGASERFGSGAGVPLCADEGINDRGWGHLAGTFSDGGSLGDWGDRIILGRTALVSTLLEVRALRSANRGSFLPPGAPQATSEDGQALVSALDPQAKSFSRKGAIARVAHYNPVGRRVEAILDSQDVRKHRRPPEDLALEVLLRSFVEVGVGTGLRVLAHVCEWSRGGRLPEDADQVRKAVGVPEEIWSQWSGESEVIANCAGRPAAVVRDAAWDAVWRLEADAAGQPGYLPREADPLTAVRVSADELRKMAEDATNGVRATYEDPDLGKSVRLTVEADGRDWIVDVDEGDHIDVRLEGALPGGIFLVGLGWGNAERFGPGTGSAGRYGGHGNSMRSGEGAGCAYHIGHGVGLPQVLERGSCWKLVAYGRNRQGSSSERYGGGRPRPSLGRLRRLPQAAGSAKGGCYQKARKKTEAQFRSGANALGLELGGHLGGRGACLGGRSLDRHPRDSDEAAQERLGARKGPAKASWPSP